MNEKTIVISSRLSPPEYALVTLMGKREGLRNSEFVRVAIREAAEKRGLYSVGKLVFAKNSSRRVIDEQS